MAAPLALAATHALKNQRMTCRLAGMDMMGGGNAAPQGPGIGDRLEQLSAHIQSGPRGPNM